MGVLVELKPGQVMDDTVWLQYQAYEEMLEHAELSEDKSVGIGHLSAVGLWCVTETFPRTQRLTKWMEPIQVVRAMALLQRFWSVVPEQYFLPAMRRQFAYQFTDMLKADGTKIDLWGPVGYPRPLPLRQDHPFLFDLDEGPELPQDCFVSIERETSGHRSQSPYWEH